MIKLRLLILIVLAGSLTAGQAAEPIQISASRKTADQRKSEKQDLVHGSTYLKQSAEYYMFQLRCMNPNIAGEVEVSWVVMVEGVDGRAYPGTHGRKQVELPFGRPVGVETDTIELNERVINRKKGRATLEQKITGYGIRVRDGSGNLLAEKFSAKSVQQELEALAKADEKEKERNKQAEKMRKKLKKRIFRGKP